MELETQLVWQRLGEVPRWLALAAIPVRLQFRARAEAQGGGGEGEHASSLVLRHWNSWAPPGREVIPVPRGTGTCATWHPAVRGLAGPMGVRVENGALQNLGASSVWPP